MPPLQLTTLSCIFALLCTIHTWSSAHLRHHFFPAISLQETAIQVFSLRIPSATLRKMGFAWGPKTLVFVALEVELGLPLAFSLHTKVASSTCSRPGESPKILGVTRVTGNKIITQGGIFFLYCWNCLSN